MITLVGAFGIFAAVMLAVYGFLALLFDDREWIGGALLCGTVVLIAVAGPALAADPPEGTVAAYATICTASRGCEEHSGFVASRDCGRALPRFWRPDTGWVASSYRCVK